MVQPNPVFLAQPKTFWANVRSISEKAGYTSRGSIRVFSYEEMAATLDSLSLGHLHIMNADGSATDLGRLLHSYFAYRADILNNHVSQRLMDAERAAATYWFQHDRLRPVRPTPLNKQTGEKRQPAFLTGLVNMIIESGIGELPCNYDPRQLTTFVSDGMPLRTLARRVDGAFPSVVQPIALWETKEYYYTTSFGSRIADGVYESLLDGMELEELREHEGIDVKHYLFVDAYRTWWLDGKSYLCRLIDMLHMGYVDEILFGYEVVENLPRITREWVTLYHLRENQHDIAID